MNVSLLASSVAPFLVFWAYGLHLIADKVIVPTKVDAAIITASGLVAALIIVVFAYAERQLVKLGQKT